MTDKKKGYKSIKELKSIFEADELERLSIAKYIHKELSPILVVLKMRLNTINGQLNDQTLVNECNSFIDQLLQEHRNITNKLVPKAIDNMGLEFALRVYLNDNSSLTKIEFTAEEYNQSEFFVEITIFRIFKIVIDDIFSNLTIESIIVSLKKKGMFIEILIECINQDRLRSESILTPDSRSVVLTRLSLIDGSYRETFTKHNSKILFRIPT